MNSVQEKKKSEETLTESPYTLSVSESYYVLTSSL